MGAPESRYLEPNIQELERQFLQMHELCPNIQVEITNEISNTLKSLGIKTSENPLRDITKIHQNPKAIDEVKTAFLDRINEFKVSEELGNRFFDHRLMGILTCLFVNFWVINRIAYEITSVTKDFFRITKNLSTGQYGVVFKAERGGSDLGFIIKAQNNTRSADLSEVAHARQGETAHA